MSVPNEAASVLLELLEALAYRKAGGSPLVMNMREPVTVAKVERVLWKAGMNAGVVHATVVAAEARARKDSGLTEVQGGHPIPR